MSSKKHPSLLCERQLRRKIASQKQSFDQEINKAMIVLRRMGEYEGVSSTFDVLNLYNYDVGTLPAKKMRCKEENVHVEYFLNDVAISKYGTEKMVRNQKGDVRGSLEKSCIVDVQDPQEEDREIKYDFLEIISQIERTVDNTNKKTCIKVEDTDYDDSVFNEDSEKLRFISNIRNLCMKYIHTIPHFFINELLAKLDEGTGAGFPKDARTFLKTPRATEIHKMGKGLYCHYSVKNAITSFILAFKSKGINADCIKLQANIDGAALAHSSEQGTWIITCSESILKLVEVIGIYHGESKPSDSNELVKMFVDEIIFFVNNGFTFDEKYYKIIFDILICDAPAKAYILKIKYHSGYWSCTKCNIKGVYDNKVCFPQEENTQLRTDDGFKNQEYSVSEFDEFQLGETIFKNIPNFGLITNVVLDYMHLICLGVMIKLIELWIQYPKVILSETQRHKISEKLVILKNFTPSDFSRNPRQFKNVRRLWKAHELRTFLLYTGPVVLRNVLPNEYYRHFLILHVGISILVNKILCKNHEYLNFAETLFKKFVNDFQILYGKRNMLFNVHNVLHLVNDVRRFGPLDDFSAFRFENHIGKLKHLIRKGDKPLQQLARRLTELKDCNYEEYNINETDFVAQPISKPFTQVKVGLLHIDCRSSKNNTVLLDDGNFVECLYFIKGNDKQINVVGYPLKIIENFYNEPLPSDYINIRIVESRQYACKMYQFRSILAKVCKLPLKNNFVVVPLSHTYKCI